MTEVTPKGGCKAVVMRASHLPRPSRTHPRQFGKISELGLSNEEIAYLREAKNDDEWLRDWSSALLEKYARQYVAVRHQRVIAHSKSMRTLKMHLDARKIRFATIAFIEHPSEMIIYAL